MAYAYDLNIQDLYNDFDSNFSYQGWGDSPFTFRGRGRSRHRRGRGRGRGIGRGRGRGKFTNKEEQPLHADLIEPQKVFVANIDRMVSEETLLESLRRFANVVSVKIINRNKGYHYRSNHKSSVYGFATLSSEEDTKILLSLSGNDLQPIGSHKYMVIKPAKKEVKLPGAPGYFRPILDDRYFELDPFNLDEPCAHTLNDDVLLKIFDYLPLKELISVERVCRRWQNLIHLNFRKFAQFDVEMDIAQVWKNTNLPLSLPAISKFLLLSGENIKKLVIDALFIEDSVKILRIIAQLCPSLEAITVKHMMTLEKNTLYLLAELVNSCKKLNEIRFLGSSICDTCFRIIMEGIPNLQILQLSLTRIRGEHMGMLPKSLKELRLSDCRCMKQNSFENLHKCTNLEILVLEKITLPGAVITSVGQNCPKLKELKVDVTFDHDKADLSNFKSLKILHFNSVNYSVKKIIKDLPHLEELKLQGIISEKETDLIDFSEFEKLKVLILTKALYGQASLQTISLCKNLEKLHLFFYSNVKDVVLSCIKKCPNLKEVECPQISLTSSDISNFVEASKRKANRIKLIIGLDKSALDEIEKLEEAKYDIEMLDTFNLFSDMESHPFDIEDGINYFDDDWSDHSDNMEDDFEDYLNMQELDMWMPTLNFINNLDIEGLLLDSDASDLEVW